MRKMKYLRRSLILCARAEISEVSSLWKGQNLWGIFFVQGPNFLRCILCARKKISMISSIFVLDQILVKGPKIYVAYFYDWGQISIEQRGWISNLCWLIWLCQIMKGFDLDSWWIVLSISLCNLLFPHLTTLTGLPRVNMSWGSLW